MVKKPKSAKNAKIASKQLGPNWRKNQIYYIFQKAETARMANMEKMAKVIKMAKPDKLAEKSNWAKLDNMA